MPGSDGFPKRVIRLPIYKNLSGSVEMHWLSGILTISFLAPIFAGGGAARAGSLFGPATAFNRTCNVLALSGGGSFGAVQGGILEGLLESQSVPASYDVITGISAGGLNAGFLSYFANISSGLPALHTILSGLTTGSVYKNGILNVLSDWSIYDNSPLGATLAGVIDGKTTASGAPITLIGATNVNSELLDVWRFDLLDAADRVDVLMATSAIPLAFPPRAINGSYYVDGGVINNEMITQAMGYVSCSAYNVVFVSASSRGGRQEINGLFSYLSGVGHVLLDTFDYQLAQFENVRCPYPRGGITACFPTATALEGYSILNFDYGSELWELGRGAYNCTQFEIC